MRRLLSHPAVTHAMVAHERYQKRLGPQFAAAVTYFSVLSMVPILMLAFSMLGLTLTVLRPDLLEQIKQAVDAQMGRGDLSKTIGGVIEHAFANWASVGIVAVLTAVYSGTNWVGHLKRAIRVMCSESLSEASHQINPFKDVLANLVIFLGLLACVTLGTTIVTVGGSWSHLILEWLGWSQAPGIWLVWELVFVLLTVAVGWLLLAFLFTVLPERRILRRVRLQGTLLGAALITAAGQVAGRLFGLFSHSAAAALFGPVIVVMLVFNVLATVILLCAAWMGTHEAGHEPGNDEP